MTRSTWIALLSATAMGLPALSGCTTTDAGAGGSASAAASPAKADVYAGKSVLDAAIAAQGGETALKAVKELDWSGTATVNAEGKTTELEVQTIVRPYTFARATSWAKGAKEESAKTIQVDFGKAWSVSRVTWTPMAASEEKHEQQQFSHYGVMVLSTLKEPGVKVTETAPGKDGTRNLHVEHPKAPPMDLRFDASGKLVQISDSVVDSKDATKTIPQVIELSGEVVSNGVKWPQRISIKQNGLPYYDLQIAKFEARGDNSVQPLKHTLEVPGQAQQQGRPGAENAG
jgi:outer membrane protein assembly factor BamE (lipoprotein component of BamABCDE complex)